MNKGNDTADGRGPADLSRRVFLRGLGASIELPTLASLGAPRLIAS